MPETPRLYRPADPPPPRCEVIALAPRPAGRTEKPPGFPSWSAWLADQVARSDRPRRMSREDENRELDRVAGAAAAERLRQCRESVDPPSAPRLTEAMELAAWIDRRQAPVLLTAEDGL